MKQTQYEKRNYVLNDQKDFTILNKIKKLERNRHRLTQAEKNLVKLARTQLKRNWRDPLITFLENMLKRKGKRNKTYKEKRTK